MRENATFLLELCSSSSSASGAAGSLAATSSSSKRSPQQMSVVAMPVVIEHQLGNSDLKPSTSRCSRMARLSGSKFCPGVGSGAFRKSFVGGPPTAPENVWLAPESFACLECLGTAGHEDLPYEMFGLGPSSNDNGYDRVSIRKLLC